MSDREKVIRGLKCCQKCSAEEPEFGCDNCPYNEISICVQDCRSVLCKDALELMKEQEPVKPIFDELDISGCCGNCGHSLTHQKMFGENVLFEEQYAYCPRCGKAVKWDAETSA